MQKFGRRLLKWTLISIGSLLLVLSVAAVLAWQHLDWLVNENHIRYALKKFSLEKQVQFENFTPRFSRIDTFRKNVKIGAKALCLHLPPPDRVDMCIPELQLDFDLAISKLAIRILNVRTITIRKAELLVELTPVPTPVAAPTMPALSAFNFEAWFGFLREYLPPAEWKIAQVELSRIDLRIDPQMRLTGNFNLGDLSRPQAFQFSSQFRWLQGKTLASSPPSVLDVTATGEFDFAQSFLKLQLSVPKMEALSAQLILQKNLTVDVSALRRRPSGRITLQSHLLVNAADLQLSNKISLQVDRLPRRLRKRVSGRPPRAELMHELHANYSFRPTDWQLDWQTDLKSPSLSGFGLSGEGHGRLVLDPAWKWEEGLSIDELKLNVRIDQFARLADDLAWAAVQIPTPFYRMKGPLELQMRTEKPTPKSMLVTGSLVTDLKDGLQYLNFDLPFRVQADNLTGPGTRIAAEAQLNLNHLELELPRISFPTIPNVLLDSRMQKKSAPKTQSKKEPLAWDLDFRVTTPQKAILLHTNLLSNPVPLKIATHSRLGSTRVNDTEYTLDVQRVLLELFRRKIQVEKIRLDKKTGQLTSIDGLLTHRNSEVKVRIRIVGSTEKPEVVWESDPPLPQRQIISIIVFGKSLNELSQEESASAQNLERAFADGALSLASLFLLASTPIESVSYDPVTQSYAARVRLGEKTSVALGSDFEDRQSLSIRRQLFGAWSIKTDIQSTGQEQDQISTFLEWFKRF